MSVHHFRRFVEHAHWGLDKLVEALWQSPERLDETVIEGARTPRDTLRHMFAFERGFLARLDGRDPSGDARPPEDLDELLMAWAPVRAGWLELLDGLTDEDLDSPIDLSRGEGAFQVTRGDILSQFVQHQGQHRSELAVMTSTFGHSPGEFDWWDFLEAQRRG